MSNLSDQDKLSNFKCPTNLSDTGISAYSAVMKILNKYKVETGGCKTFYSPAEWKDRVENYGNNSHLIIVYDGGDVKHFFNMDYQCYELYDEMQKSLQKIGLYFEECTNWYSAIYCI